MLPGEDGLNQEQDEKRTITVRDVAQKAGVGTSTVSRVINNQTGVHANTRREILKVMLELGYQPHVMAQGLRHQKFPTIGMVVSNITNPLFAAIVQATEACLQQQGYQLLLGITNGDLQKEAIMFETLVRQRVSGIIASVVSDRTDRSLRTALDYHIPVVLLDREIAGLEVDGVTHDYATGSQQAIEYLVNLGHRVIGLIISTAILPGRARLTALQDHMLRLGLSLPAECLCDVKMEAEEGYRAMQGLLALANRPTAVIAGSNQLFVGVLKALREARLRYPDDLSLISYDDVDITRLVDPAITVVTRDLAQFGREAADLILKKVQGGQQETQRRSLPTELLIRESCASPK